VQIILVPLLTRNDGTKLFRISSSGINVKTTLRKYWSNQSTKNDKLPFVDKKEID
jgi:hypothetical protein